MPYRVVFTTEAKLDMRRPWLTPGEAARVVALAPDQLRHEPGRLGLRNRKRLRPNTLGLPWELRLGDLRAYYEIDEDEGIVWVLRVGRKPRETVRIRGVEYDLGEESEP